MTENQQKVNLFHIASRYGRRTCHGPALVTAISLADGATGTVTVSPPGQRTINPVGASGVASTGTAPSCDQYPLPA